MNHVVTTVAGSGTSGFIDGVSTNAQLNNPSSLAVFTATNELYITQSTTNCHLRKMNIATRVVSTVGASCVGPAPTDGFMGITLDVYSRYIYWTAPAGVLYGDMITGTVDRVSAALSGATGYLDGVGTIALMNFAAAVLQSAQAKYLYTLDSMNYRIRRIYAYSVPIVYTVTPATTMQGHLSQQVTLRCGYIATPSM